MPRGFQLSKNKRKTREKQEKNKLKRFKREKPSNFSGIKSEKPDQKQTVNGAVVRLSEPSKPDLGLSKLRENLLASPNQEQA